jgi:fumarylacetoacetase
MIKANKENLESWVYVKGESDFPIQNLPFGIFSLNGGSKKAASAIGDYVVDLDFLHGNGFFDGIELPEGIFSKPVLNDFIGLGKTISSKVRHRLSDIFDKKIDYNNASSRRQEFLIGIDAAVMHLPLQIGDYTDFYSSREHATNVGMMFRDPENALLPNWLHLPVGYHGRASSIVVSGTDIKRPMGQTMQEGANKPDFGPCRLMDFELEMAFVIGKSNELGKPIAMVDAQEHIFGLMLFNDWSARDLQKWEYVPLGPFTAKNFASTVSPWIVTLEALEPFRVKGPEQEPEVLPYLQQDGANNYDIDLFVDIEPEDIEPINICKSNFKYMYWSMAQQLAHHTITGCNMQIGDLCASGTISGPDKDSYGSMLELSWKGTKPIELSDGVTRTFLKDGDTVHLRAKAGRGQVRIGFGPCKGKVLPPLY